MFLDLVQVCLLVLDRLVEVQLLLLVLDRMRDLGQVLLVEGNLLVLVVDKLLVTSSSLFGGSRSGVGSR